MNNIEISNEFDALLNSFGDTPNIILDEYEKSVFLTKAQEGLIIDIYSGKNPFNDSFEKSEEIRRYLSKLIETYKTDTKITDVTGISNESTFFKIPEDVWFITYESAVLDEKELPCLNNKEVIVTPVRQDNFFKIKRNPFRGPSKDRILRLDTKGDTVELVSTYNIGQYILRYLSRPSPIILINLPDDLSINGVKAETECKLNPVVHRAILERAVRLALMSKTQLTGEKK